ncbi:MAG: CoA pyrophosphatase [Chloroflexota bacterium]|nr:CoA pyrophosphatase [Chloroflexota bacterium]
MDRILRGGEGWQEAIAHALADATRPISADPRFAPRQVAGGPTLRRYDRSTFPPARPAATLLLVYPGVDRELTVPLTVRHADLREHAGEISLPGGAVDAADVSQEATALREAWEEVGVDPAVVTIAGVLDDIWIPVSNFELRPFVGTAAARPALDPHTDEVAEIVELPLRHLLTDEAVSEELIEGAGWSLRAAVYRHAGHRIWGATARTLAMFAAVLQEGGITP